MKETPQQRYHRKHREEHNAAGRAYRAKNREKMHALHRKNQLAKYGLTPSDYDKMFESQGGRCAICRRVETNRNRGRLTNLRVDHNHKTGKVRALLCNDCNVSLGKMGESPERLREAALYLEKWEEK